MPSGVLWTLLPDEALSLVLIGAGLALMLGFRQAAFGLLTLMVLFPVLTPFIETFFAELPPWVALVILAFVGLVVLRGVVALLIGQQAANTMVGSLADDVIRLVVGILFFPVRMAWWMFRLIGR